MKAQSGDLIVRIIPHLALRRTVATGQQGPARTVLVSFRTPVSDRISRGLGGAVHSYQADSRLHSPTPLPGCPYLGCLPRTPPSAAPQGCVRTE